MTHVIIATWKAKPGKADEVAQILRELAPKVRNEPCAPLFLANRSLQEPDVFVLYEQYRDEAAFIEHQQTEHFKRLVLERALPLLAHRERPAFSLLP